MVFIRGIVFVLLCNLSQLTMAGDSVKFTFDGDALGGVPKGWVGGVTGEGSARWTVSADPAAPSKPNVLKQSGEGTYVWGIVDKVAIKNGYVQTRFMALTGKEDQAGGLVWRFVDKDNYYVTRANVLENNVRIYRVVGGRRTMFGSANVDVTGKQWHLLRVGFNNDVFTVSFNGKELLKAQDDRLQAAGGVGLWTKADSVTVFDDMEYANTN